MNMPAYTFLTLLTSSKVSAEVRWNEPRSKEALKIICFRICQDVEAKDNLVPNKFFLSSYSPAIVTNYLILPPRSQNHRMFGVWKGALWVI